MPVAQKSTRGRHTYFDLEAVAAWDAARRSADQTIDAANARARKDLALARLTEIKIDVEEGRLVPREAVVSAGRAYTIAWTAKVRGLPRRLVKEGLVEKASEAAVISVVREILEDIAAWRVDAQH